MTKRVLIVGCGYVGLPLGQELARQGNQVFGLRRSPAMDAAMGDAGITPLHGDITQSQTLEELPREFDWVVNCAATSGGTAEDYRQLYVVGNFNLIEWLRPAPPEKFLYTSSTSVYGQDDAAWVAEDNATQPTSETAQILVETEQLLLGARRQWQWPVIIARVAGIYGPERGYWLRQFLRGEARLEGDGSRHLNMIHRDDLIGAIILALEKAAPGLVFNAVDNEPASQREVFAWLSQRLGRPLPPSVDPATTVRRRGVTNKRVANARLTQQLGYRFHYPTFREGFEAEMVPA